MAVLPTGLSIRLSDVARGTFTDVGTYCVLTYLGTDKGCLLAFINIITAPIIRQKLVTRTTRTIETGEGVCTVLVTATE